MNWKKKRKKTLVQFFAFAKIKFKITFHFITFEVALPKIIYLKWV